MSTRWRTARIFISSTFKDMQAERDHLVRVVFPKLRQLLETRHIYLEEIDLRWGITREQAENAETLDLCLGSIDECRPFFVGLIGERYGSILADAPHAVLEARGLTASPDTSVTEMEIAYGVFSRAAPKARAFFFFRDPGLVRAIPAKRRADYESVNAAAKLKLTALKERIRQSGCPLIDGYAADWKGDATGQIGGLEAFGESVFDALSSALADEYPRADETVTSNADDEAELHARFIETRARVFVGRKQPLDELRRFTNAADGRPCLVFGQSGFGKSAFLAQFVITLRAERPETLIIPHFVGASDRSTDLAAMLTRFYATLLPIAAPLESQAGYAFDDPDAVPGDLLTLKLRFGQLLARVPADRRLCIVIDAIDQLNIPTANQPLDWLPADIPHNVKVIASCVDNSERGAAMLAAFRQRSHVPVEIAALTDQERMKVIREVPSLSAKSLDAKQIKLLADNRGSESPLFLRAALEELRTFGSHEGLTKRIQDFPKQKSGLFGARGRGTVADLTRELFAQILERLEGEFGVPGVERAMAMMACSRRGLRERELVGLTEGCLTPEDVYTIVRQMRPYLFSKAGTLNFFHQEVIAAVRARYLPGAGPERAAHAVLADYFDSVWRAARDSADADAPRALARACDETPWQMIRAHAYARAGRLLIEPNFLEAKAQAGLINELPADFSDILAATRAIPFAEQYDGKRLRDVRRAMRASSYTMDESSAFPRKVLTALDEALRRDMGFLERRPQLLFQCLWNSAWWVDCPDWLSYADMEHLGEIAREVGETLSDDVHLIKPETFVIIGLAEHMDNWRKSRQSQSSIVTTLRALLPPVRPLGADGITIVANTDTLVSIPQRRQLVTAGEGAIRVWHADTGEQLRVIVIGKDERAASVTTTSDGKKLAACVNGAVRVYDVETGELTCELAIDGDPETQFTFLFPASKNAPPFVSGGGVTFSAISASGGRLASARSGKTAFTIWDVALKRRAHVLTNPFPILGLSYVGDARVIVSGFVAIDERPSVNLVSALWDVEKGMMLFEVPREIMRYSQNMKRILMSSPGAWVEDGGANTEVHEINKTGSAPVVSAAPINLDSSTIAFSEDGSLIAVAPERWNNKTDPDVKIYHVDTGALVQTLRPGHSGPITSLAFLTSGDVDKVSRVDAKELTADLVEATVYGLKPDWFAEPRIASASSDGAVRSFPLSQRAIRAAWPHSNDAKLGAADKRQRLPWWGTRHKARIQSIDFSADGEMLLTCASDKTMLWRVADGRAVRPPGAGSDCGAFAPDARSYAIAGRGALAVFATADGAMQASSEIACDYFGVLTYSRDGAMLAVSASNGCTHIFAAPGLSPIRAIPNDAGVVGLDFHPDGSLIAISQSNGFVRLVRVQSGEELGSFDITGSPPLSPPISLPISQVESDKAEQSAGESLPANRNDDNGSLADAHSILSQPRTDETTTVKFSSTGEFLVTANIITQKSLVWTLEGARVEDLNFVAEAAAYPLLGRPWRLGWRFSGGLDLVVSTNVGGREIAYYPLPGLPHLFATHPSGSVFAAACEANLVLLRMEDFPALGDSIRDEAKEARARADAAMNEGDLEGARRDLERAIALYSYVPGEERLRTAPDFMRALRGLAVVLTTQNEAEAAIARGDAALDVGRILISQDGGQAYLDEVAQIASAQSERFEILGRSNDALKAKAEALELRRRHGELGAVREP